MQNTQSGMSANFGIIEKADSGCKQISCTSNFKSFVIMIYKPRRRLDKTALSNNFS